MKTTHSKIKTLAALTLASAMGLATTEAGAVILLIKTGKNLQASPDYTSTALVDFNGPAAGGTESTFTTSAANQDVLISFHAECQGIDPSAGVDYEFHFVLADIEVDPQGSAGWQTVSPTGDSPGSGYFPQLCSGPGYNYSGLDAHAKLPAGTHKIRVRIGSHLNGASIRAKSLVVQR